MGAVSNPFHGERLGDYELLQRLGEGGMGEVYIAKHVHQENLVALKVARPAVLESTGGAAIFLREIRTASSLAHPNIVRIYTSGTAADGRLYLVMPLLEGGALAHPDNRRRFCTPKEAMALMIPIARAVQFAHGRAVLHCDLKPENILLDEAGVPHVSDFGLARVIGKPGSSYQGTVQGGTPGWMSPEQEARQELTVGSDVFSLGLLLRWLLAGQPRALRGQRWELGTIADRATQPRPERRYQSAGELADELERVRDRYPIQAERHLPLRRARKWARRHPWIAAGAVQAMLLLVYLALTPFSVLREVRSVVGDENAFAAVAQAGSVMNELRSSAARVEALAAAPEIRALVRHPNLMQPAPALTERLGSFDHLAVLSFDPVSRTVILRARSPRLALELQRRDFTSRDYVHTLELNAGRPRGAPPKAYVSRVFKSAPDGLLHIGFAAPIFDDDDQVVGLLLGSTAARATFGAVQMNCTGNGDCMTALLGSRDRNGADEPLPDALNVLAEPGLARGQDKVLDPATARRLCRALGCTPRLHDQLIQPAEPKALMITDYPDPVTCERSIAAVAPVGGTGLLVVVATANTAVAAPDTLS